MSDFNRNLMWALPSSPSPKMILTMLNQMDNGLNPMNEIFPQANLSKDHNDQSEKRHGLGERLASRIGFNPPRLDRENISLFSTFFRNQTVPSPITLVSPGFSPSALLKSPNMFSNSSQLDLPCLNTNYGPPVMVACFNEGNATTPIFNNDLPHEHLNTDLPFQEESIVEPLSVPLVSSFEPDAIGVARNDFLHQPLNDYLPHQEVTSFESDATVEVNTDFTHQPWNLDLPSKDDNLYYIPSPESNIAPLVAHAESDTVDEVINGIFYQPLDVDLPPPEEPFSANLATKFESNAIKKVSSSLPHQSMDVNLPMNVDLPSQEESDIVNEVNIISVEEESKSADKEKNNEEKVEDRETTDVDTLNDGSPSSKKRNFEEINMIGNTRKNKTQRIILQMESEEDKPDDGFHWIKYGHKVVKGNPNARSYYKCKSNGCKVKKRIERGAEDNRLVITTYDDIHNHPTPLEHRKGRGSHSMIQSDSTMSQNWNNQTDSQLSMPPSSVFTSPNMRAAFSGLSKLPSLPVNHQNLDFMNWNEEQIIDTIPDGTAVYNRIWNQIYANFGTRISSDML